MMFSEDTQVTGIVFNIQHYSVHLLYKKLLCRSVKSVGENRSKKVL